MAERDKVPHHGRHDWLQPGDRPDRVFILRFDDADRRDQYFSNQGAGVRALTAYALVARKFNVTLFAALSVEEAGRLLAPPADQTPTAILAREFRDD